MLVEHGPPATFFHEAKGPCTREFLDQIHCEMRLRHHDAVVVGSGFGGAVLACRLAEAGRSVLVLERGREWAVEEYPSISEKHWIWDVDRPEGENGWIDVRAFRNMAVVLGAGVGGGSLIYANVSVEAEAQAFARGWPAGLDLCALRESYAKVGEMLEVRTLPEGQLTERFRLVRDAADSCGYRDRFRKLDLAVRFDEDWSYSRRDAHDPRHSVRTTNDQGIEQGTCVHCGKCMVGCPVQAKNTLDLNYLASARRDGAEILPLHLVSHVAALERGYSVHFERLEGGARVPGEVSADEVYLAAGSLGTTEILLRSRDLFKTLDRLSDRLGQGWSANGDFFTLAFYPRRPISPTRGPPASCAISFLDGSIDGSKFFVEDGGFPDSMGDILREVAGRNPSLSSTFAAFAKLPGKHVPFHLVMPWLSQGIDASDGTLSLKPDPSPPGRWKLDLDWNPEASKPTVDALVRMHRKLSRTTGGIPVVPPGWTRAGSSIAPHPLGGARMADCAAEGVVDQWGEVFGHPGLFVVDGAAIPRPIGLNPARTISAVAERMAACRLTS